MKINPDESAFPSQELNPGASQTPLSWGLTKREYFAAVALQGLLAGGPRLWTIQETVQNALSCADALIEALYGEMT